MTGLARAWAVRRKDGLRLGFTDHDAVLRFDGIVFRPDSGLGAKAVVQGLGLSVDNTEAVGALSHEAITEADIAAGRWDGAEVRLWEVDWAAPANRREIFRGHLGEVGRTGGAFRAELRGLAEPLAQVQGRVYHPRCSARLGDAACGVNIAAPGYFAQAELVRAAGAVLRFDGMGDFADRWFEQGLARIETGAAAGLSVAVKRDRLLAGGAREVTLWSVPWEAAAITPEPGDRVRLIAGCDKRAETCRFKFANFLNFRGFPHLPQEDWLMSPQVERARPNRLTFDNPLAGGLILDEVVSIARRWIGTPYVHQASVRGAGADCLGLIRGVWRTLYGGEPEALPPYTPDWGETGRQELLLAGALRHLEPAQVPERPGEVLLFRMRAGAVAKHLGIGAGSSFIHAYDRHGVVESPLSAPWRARIVARFRFPGA